MKRKYGSLLITWFLVGVVGYLTDVTDLLNVAVIKIGIYYVGGDILEAIEKQNEEPT